MHTVRQSAFLGLALALAVCPLWSPASARSQPASPAPAIAAGPAAVEPLANRSAASVDRLISTLTSNGYPRLRARAAIELASKGDIAIVPLIAAIDRHDRNADAAGRLAWVLASSVGDPNDELLDWLKQDDPAEEARNGLLAEGARLGVQIPPENIDLLVDQHLALHVLAERGLRSLPALRTLLRETEPRLVRSGLWLATRLGPLASSVTPELTGLVESLPGGERAQAVAALGAVGPTNDAELGAWLAGDPAAAMRPVHAGLVAPNPTIIPALARAVRAHPSAAIQQSAASVLSVYLENSVPGTVPARSVAPVLKSFASLAALNPELAVNLAVAVDPEAPELVALAPDLMALARDRGSEEARRRFIMLEQTGRATGPDPFENLVRVLAGMPQSTAVPQGLPPLARHFLDEGPADSALIVLETIQTSANPIDLPEPLVSELGQRLLSEEDFPRTIGRFAALVPHSPAAAEAISSRIIALHRESESEHAYGTLLAVLAVYWPRRVEEIAGRLSVRGRVDPFCRSLESAWTGELEHVADDEARLTPARKALSTLAQRACIRPFQSATPFTFDRQLKGILAVEEDRRWELIDRYINEAIFAPNAAEALLALIREPSLGAFSLRADRICAPVVYGILRPGQFDLPIRDKDWDVPIRLPKCFQDLDPTRSGWAFARLLNRDPAGFAVWAATNGDIAAADLSEALESLAREPGPPNGQELIRHLARSDDPRIAQWGLDALALRGRVEKADREIVLTRMASSDSDVAMAAVEAAIDLRLVDLADETDPAARTARELLVLRGIEDNLAAASAQFSDEPRPAAGPPSLPAFPWPPPVYSHRILFGQDVRLSLLGSSDTSLGAVHRRLIRALQQVSPNFEQGLFGAPGGFALMTRLEQTDDKGRPLGGQARWMDVRPPPSSLSDYLMRLFLAPPGYYRTIVFLFTDQPNFTTSNRRLPDIRAGGIMLPERIARIRLGQIHAFALIYYFERRDGGYPRLNTRLGGPVHLVRSGLAARLQAQ